MEEKFINITEAARDFLRESVAKNEALGIRVSVVSGGCQGTAYDLTFAKEVNPSDLILEEDGLSVHVASEAALFVAGMTLDYVTGPLGGNIVFENPNARSKCGCGKSFRFDESDPASRGGGCCR